MLAADRRLVCMCIKLPVSLWYHEFRMGCFLNSDFCLCLIYYYPYYPSSCSFQEFQSSSCLQVVLKRNVLDE
jgi:hypothetical protein